MEEAVISARSPGVREPVISVGLDELYEEYARSRRRTCPLCCVPRFSLARCCHGTCFCLQFIAAAVAAAAPWALAVAEALTVLLVYFLAVRGRGGWQHRHYSFSSSAADLVVLSLVRCVAVSAVYACRPGLLYHRPYLLAAAGYACITIPVAAAKIAAVKHSSTAARRLPAFLALGALQIVFSVLHVAAAQGVLVYARKRWLLGLTSPGVGLQDEEGWTLWSPAGAGHGGEGIDCEKDVPPEHLADADSLFVDDCAGPGPPLSVHYKVAAPRGSRARELGTVSVVLIHPYGGGVHSWRLVMQPLADAAGVQVVAFDRPGFGLTSRPLPPPPPEGPPGSNPFSLEAHAALAVRLAAQLGLERVVFAGTEDGALVALMAAASLLRPSWPSGAPARRAPAAASPAGLPPPSPSSVGGSLDLGWMGSVVSPASRKSLLQKLLQGEWNGEGAAGEGRRGDGYSALDSAASGSGPPGAGSTACARAVSEHAGGDAPPAEAFFELDMEGGVAAPTAAAAGTPPRFPPRGIHAHTRTLSSIPSVEPEAELVGASVRGAEGAWGPDTGSQVELAGLALLHPDLSGRCGSQFLRLLGRSRLGRRVLRDLLGSELGAVSNRAAWADETSLTPDILAIYRRPMQCIGWDAALLGVSTASTRLPAKELSAMLEALSAAPIGDLPALVVTGEQDKLATPAAATQLEAQLGGARLEVLPGCGHLSYEEHPEALALTLATFVRQALR